MRVSCSLASTSLHRGHSGPQLSYRICLLPGEASLLYLSVRQSGGFQLFHPPSLGQGTTSQAGDSHTAEGAELVTGAGVNHQRPTLLPSGAWSLQPDDRVWGMPTCSELARVV